MRTDLNSGKLAYHAPKLEIFGTMQELTASDPNTSTGGDSTAGWGSSTGIS